MIKSFLYNKRKLRLTIFVIIVILITARMFGYGIHKAYYSDRLEKDANGTYSVKYRKSPNSPYVVYFDLKDNTLKTNTVWFVGKYYNPPCYAFGCGDNLQVSLWIPFFWSKKEFLNKCMVEDYKETIKQINCESGREVESRLGVGSDKGYYLFNFSDFIDTTTNKSVWMEYILK